MVPRNRVLFIVPVAAIMPFFLAHGTVVSVVKGFYLFIINSGIFAGSFRIPPFCVVSHYFFFACGLCLREQIVRRLHVHPFATDSSIGLLQWFALT